MLNSDNGRALPGITGLLVVTAIIVGGTWFWLNQRAGLIELESQIREALQGAGADTSGLVVRGRDVELNGKVDSESERQIALEILRQIDGIETVSDQRTLRRGTPPSLQISAFGDTVIVRGLISDRSTPDDLISAITDAWGEVRIDSSVEVSETVIQSAWENELPGLLSVLAAIEPMTFRVDSGQVSVTGTARTKQSRNILDRALRQAFGEKFLVINEVVLSGDTDTAALSFRRTGPDLSLRGVFPSQAMVDAVVGAVRTHFPGTRIHYDLSLNSEASEPGWLEGALTLLEALAAADPAELEIDNHGYELSGSVRSESVRRRLESAAADAFADPLPAEITIAVSQPAESALLVIRVADGDVTLEGTLPSRSFETAVLSRADLAFGPDRVTNLLQISEDVRDPEWLDQALSQIEQLRSKPNAVLTASDTGIDLQVTRAIAGEAESPPQAVSDTGQVRMVYVGETSEPASGRAEPGPAASDTSPDTAQAGAPSAYSTPSDSQLAAALSRIDLAPIMFTPNSPDLIPGARAVLEEIATALMAHPESAIEIGGHTDSQGSESYNQTLSQQRADSVRRFLIERGVPADRLVSRGYGESRPLASNDSAEGRARNRRIAIRVLN